MTNNGKYKPGQSQVTIVENGVKIRLLTDFNEKVGFWYTIKSYLLVILRVKYKD